MLSSGGCRAAKEAPGCRGRGRTRQHLGVPQKSQRQTLVWGQGTGSGAPLHLSSDSKAHISLEKWGLGVPEVLIPASDGRSSGRDNSSCRADFLLHHVWAESPKIGAGKDEMVMMPGCPPPGLMGPASFSSRRGRVLVSHPPPAAMSGTSISYISKPSTGTVSMGCTWNPLSLNGDVLWTRSIQKSRAHGISQCPQCSSCPSGGPKTARKFLLCCLGQRSEGDGSGCRKTAPRRIKGEK